MGKFMTGEIVVLNFPFSNLSGAKRRPALVVANPEGNDIILCQITSNAKIDKYAIKLKVSDFASGNLTAESVVRPNKIFTADESIILYSACKISREKLNEVTKSIFSMLEKPQAEFPILEFDTDKNAHISPAKLIKPIDIAENAVLCFFNDAIETLLSETPYRVAYNVSGEMPLPVYELDYEGGKVVLVRALVGSPLTAILEDLAALGCKKFIACGGAGVLDKNLAVGHIIIPTSAIRDEGTSYHYIAPSREIKMDETVVQHIEKVLFEKGVSFVKGKTWTTDAMYRETPARIKRRKEEGCITVEMEASAFMAVSQYLGTKFGQILYAGDNLDCEVWDSRSWYSRTDVRASVLKLALDVCVSM